MINWIPLTAAHQVEEIRSRSATVPCAIFKHSTRCSISSMAKYRLEESWDFRENELEMYYLDLIAHRDISTLIAETFSVYHESPQLILIRDGESTYDASHLDITVDELRECFEDTF
ncbi:MAG: bacillithiol system redox-active protein YtxJ [Bacteroidota bacterium]